MASILVACNNDMNVDLHNFMQYCADVAKQYCRDHNHDFTSVVPPFLTETNVLTTMQNHHICFIAAHGDADGVYNEKDLDVITTRTTNYSLANKGLYTVACSCAQNLYNELSRIGLKLFVGYNAPFIVGDNEEVFCECALEGLKHILQGKTLDIAYQEMLNKYDEAISHQSFKDKIFLLRNKERLVFSGEDTVSLSDLI